MAKYSNKIIKHDDLIRKSRKLAYRLNPSGKSLEQLGKGLNKIAKAKELNDLAHVGLMVDSLPTPLKFVKYLKTRTQWEYILPHQYDLVTNIQLYIDAVQDKMNKNAVKYKQLFTKQDED